MVHTKVIFSMADNPAPCLFPSENKNPGGKFSWLTSQNRWIYQTAKVASANMVIRCLQ